MFEDIRHERSLKLLPSSTHADVIKQSGDMDHEMNIMKNLALKSYVDINHSKNTWLHNY